MAEKDRRVMENMKRSGELGMLLNGIPNPNSPYLNICHRQHHNQLGNGSPVGRVSLRSESSPSSSFSNGFCSSEDASPYPDSFEEVKHQTSSTQYLSINGKPGDDMGLCETLYRIHMDDRQGDSTDMRGFEVDFDGFGLYGSYLGVTTPWNVDHGECNGFSNRSSGFEGFQSSHLGAPVSFVGDRRLKSLGFQGGYRESDSTGSYLAHHRLNALDSGPSSNANQMNYSLDKRNGSGCYYGGIQRRNQSTVRPHLRDALVSSRGCEISCNGVTGVMEPLSSPPSKQHPKLALNVDDSSSSRPIINERTREILNSVVPQSSMSTRGAEDVEAFSCDDNFIIKGGNCLNYSINKKPSNTSRSHKKNCRNEMAETNQRGKSSEWDSHCSFANFFENDPIPSGGCPLFSPLPSCSLAEVQGYIYFLAKDQYGCRFLQKVFDKGACQDVQIIFNEIIGHVVELITDPFGNYLVQKLLDVCNEEQRMQIVLKVTNQPGQLMRISLDPHGTRVVQKLIETVETKKQISLLSSALELGFLTLIKDPNGNHVIQRCLQCFSNEDNKFIFVAAAKFCVDMATHRHGCCVLQRCIARSIAEHREKLVTEVSRDGILLAQDPYGNYVVQYLIELKIPSASSKLISQFKGNYAQLSMQKFSSHVVEKCLTHFEEHRSRIIYELLSVSHFDQLLQDRFANYVIQRALAVTKGPLHASLVEQVEAYKILSTNPYCRRIFSRKLLKK